MALILKQQSTGSVPTPDTGKSVIFVDTTGQIGVKQPSGTSVVTGNITAVNLDGNVSNVLSGAGTWIAAGGGGGGGSSISNGTSNVNIATSGGDITLSAAGTSNVVVVSSSGATLSSLSVSGTTSLGPVGNVTITGGSSGQVLRTNGSGVLSWVNQSGGGGSPGGSDTQVQFNDSGSFGGDAGFTYDKANALLTLTSATIGNIYYSDNIVSPIPVWANTSYGNVLVPTPMVVNSPLTVLSGSTTDTTYLTFSSTQLTGSQSGGVNNTVTISPYTSSTYPGGAVVATFFSNYLYASQYSQLKAGDIITGVGTNGYYTGTLTFTVNQVIVTNTPTPYNVVIEIYGQVVNPDNTMPTVAAFNVMTVVRPYSESSVVGGLSAENYISTNEVTGNVVLASTKLISLREASFGATQYVAPIIADDYLANKITMDCRAADYAPTSFGTLFAAFQGFRVAMYYPETSPGLRKLTFVVTFVNGATIDLSATTIDVTLYDPYDIVNSTTGTVAVKWANNTTPTSVTSGQTVIFNYTFQTSGSGTYNTAFASYQIFG